LSPALVNVACSDSSTTGGSEDGGTDGLGPDANPTGDDGGDATTETGGDSGPDAVSSDGGETGTTTDADTGSADAPHEGSSVADADAGAADAPSADAPAEASTVPDAEAGASDGGPCNALTNAAPVIATSIGSGSPPAAIGGTIPDGTYYLTDAVLYPSIDAGSSGPGLETVQETAVITGTTANVVTAMGPYSDGGVGAPQYFTETFAPSGTSLGITFTCGQTASGTAPYSVNTSDGGPTTISLLISNTLFTLTKQ
jgi:hypothetical protein